MQTRGYKIDPKNKIKGTFSTGGIIFPELADLIQNSNIPDMFGQKQDRLKILAYHGIADDLYKVHLVDDCLEKF